MRQTKIRTRSWMTVRAFVAAGSIGLMICSAPLAAAAAASNGDERVVSYLAIDPAQVESLQRWVLAGHEEWCKDARLVAAQELKRIAQDYSGDVMELSASDELADGSKSMTFEWAPLDGRATYRVTVARFEWLLPIAKDPDAIVWVPTRIEIRQNGEGVGSDEDKSYSADPLVITKA